MSSGWIKFSLEQVQSTLRASGDEKTDQALVLNALISKFFLFVVLLTSPFHLKFG